MFGTGFGEVLPCLESFIFLLEFSSDFGTVLLCLFKSIPNARVVPVSIANSWKFGEQKYFPLPLGVKLHLTVHDPLEINHNEPEKFIERIENFIGEDVRRKQEKKSNL